MSGSGELLVRLCEALGLGSAPELILARLRSFYDEVDARIQVSTSGLDLPCRMGCSQCCHEAVFVSAGEFFAVVFALREAQTPLEPIVKQMQALALYFRDELELLERLAPGEERNEVAARIRFRCPLLTETEQCSVYAWRELNARTFGKTHDSQNGSPYGCEATHERLQILGQEGAARLTDARNHRRALTLVLPRTEIVQVYPWWFDRYADVLLQDIGL